jgi:hypothetical protein
MKLMVSGVQNSAARLELGYGFKDIDESGAVIRHRLGTSSP